MSDNTTRKMSSHLTLDPSGRLMSDSSNDVCRTTVMYDPRPHDLGVQDRGSYVRFHSTETTPSPVLRGESLQKDPLHHRSVWTLILLHPDPKHLWCEPPCLRTIPLPDTGTVVG